MPELYVLHGSQSFKDCTPILRKKEWNFETGVFYISDKPYKLLTLPVVWHR